MASLLVATVAVGSAESAAASNTPPLHGRFFTALTWGDPSLDGSGDQSAAGSATTDITDIFGRFRLCVSVEVIGSPMTEVQLRRGGRGEVGTLAMPWTDENFLTCSFIDRAFAAEVLTNPAAFHLLVKTEARRNGAMRASSATRSRRSSRRC